ncbi:peroxidase 5-like [Cryptomeria japonica]|uniref:peroxidase 5-like n=1 Tax=Cryptomeria japonica TaxID=3369 RepID=UPI0027DA75D5|nr:peroxidase 5-like [Cryptomeria japonica]
MWGLSLVSLLLLVIPLFVLFLSTTASGQGLKVGYYYQTCPEAEEIISQTVAKAVKANPGVAASLIRMHFHDCFVRGCDGSILLDSSDNKAEKDSPVNNPSLRGYDIIDEAKAKLEAKCAGVVSCADVVAFAARDSAYQAGGLFWAVEGGRRDGRISRESEVTDNIPSPSFDVSRLTQFFASKQLSQEDMVTLSGAHSIGVSHCSSFTGDRLYNFSGRGGQDPSMDSKYALQLKAKCPTSASSDIVVPLDPLTPTKLDAKYFVDLQEKRGLLKSDQTLMSNDATYRQVNINAKYPTIWRINFGRAMVKMGAIDVSTGSQGEIRKQCRVPN